MENKQATYYVINRDIWGHNVQVSLKRIMFVLFYIFVVLFFLIYSPISETVPKRCDESALHGKSNKQCIDQKPASGNEFQRAGYYLTDANGWQWASIADDIATNPNITLNGFLFLSFFKSGFELLVCENCEIEVWPAAAAGFSSEGIINYFHITGNISAPLNQIYKRSEIEHSISLLTYAYTYLYILYIYVYYL
jgi:hypothetical protein